MSSEWPTVTIDDVCELIVDCVNKTAPVVEGPTPYRMIRTTNIRNGRIDLNECRFVDEATYAKWTRRAELRFGDVLLTREAPIGEVGFVLEPKGLFLGQRVMQYRANAQVLSPRFLLYSFLSPALQHQFGSHEGSGSVVSHIRVGDCFKFKLKLPSLPVQNEIATLLGALDDRIALLRETNATLEAIAKALFKSWFVDFDPVRAKSHGLPPSGMDEATAALFPDGFEESAMGLVPNGWRVATIGTLAEVIDCLHSKKPEFVAEGRPFLQLNNIRDDGLLDTSRVSVVSEADYAKWISRAEATEGDCVITNVGRVGAVAQIPAGFRAAMGRNMTAIRLRSGWPYPTYLIELLQSESMRAEIQLRTDVGTILDALNVRNIPLLRCVAAPPDVMGVFESVCRPLRAAMEANMERVQVLATLRDTLLPRLISGQLRLPNAEALAATA